MDAASDAPLAEFAEVMRRLREECPWKREQTHRSLARYLLEETHETLEVIDVEPVDDEHLVEELGDLLLQVFFHAAIAEERGAFTIDDVAAGITAKMIRRNPHVFGSRSASPLPTTQDAAAVNDEWQRIKAAEKSERTSPIDGIPPTLPALLYADKVLDRLARSSSAVPRSLSLLLVPSPFLGPASWAPLARVLTGLGHEVRVVETCAGPTTTPAEVLTRISSAVADDDVVLVAHSNAGLYAAALAGSPSVRGVVYVDAALPLSLDDDSTTALAPPELREALAGLADQDGVLPEWSRWWGPGIDPLAGLDLEEPRLPLSYLAGRLPVPTAWAEQPSAYLGFGETYADEITFARGRGWPARVVDGGHLRALHDPQAVAAEVLALVEHLAPATSTDLGERLLALVEEARADGVDPEQALRDAVRRRLPT